MWGVWQEQMEQVSKKGKQHVFSVTLTTIILNCFLCVLDKRSRERIKTWAKVHVHVWNVFLGSGSQSTLPPGLGGKAMSEGKFCLDRNRSLKSWCRLGKLDRPGGTSETLSWGCTNVIKGAQSTTQQKWGKCQIVCSQSSTCTPLGCERQWVQPSHLPSLF